LSFDTARTAALTAIASIAVSAPASAQATSSASTRLSNETTFTRWAYAVARATAYSAPSRSAHRVGRLRLLTEDGFPEVYVLLSSMPAADGTRWVHVRLPQRPNNVTGWVPRRSVGDFQLVHTQLVVNRRTLRATLYDGGKRRFRARVGVGKPSTPTPHGSFWIREKFRVRGNPVYGGRALGTAGYSNQLTDWPGGGVIGIHGTNEPGLIPGRPSHGCIRMRNPDIERLYRLTPVGTPLVVR
jgi:lipoprotein-anchoring transpeptidase ErfK/SrfK